MGELNGPIVVGIDGSEAATRALDWAADEARQVGSALRMVAAWTPPRFESGATNAREAAESALTAARQHLAEAGHGDLEVSAEAVNGAPRTVLLQAAEQARALVVGRSGADRLRFLGSTALAVATDASGVLVVVVPEHWQTQETRGKVVVGYDGSAQSRPALTYAFDEANRRQAALTVVMALDLVRPIPDGAPMPDVLRRWKQIQQEAARDLERVLAPLRAEFPGVEVVGEVDPGDATGALHQRGKDADLLVIGTRGYGVITGMLLGSIARKILHMADVPTAVVRA